MARDSLSISDPFADPIQDTTNADHVDGAILPVGRNASLTLGTDSLIVLDEDFTRRGTSNCCGLLPSSTISLILSLVECQADDVEEAKTTQAIPFFNVLWAELSDFDVTIQYAKPVSKNVVRAAAVNYFVEKPQQRHAQNWVSRLLDRAYGESQRRKRIKLLVNPFGGKGSAQKWFLRDVEPILAAARCEVDVERTLYRGHAVEIAEKLDIDAFDVIASCSGDGLPHEVFNGLGKKDNASTALSKIAVVQLPCGTGNAMSWNLNGTDSNSMAALCVVKGIRTPIDLVSITQGQQRILSFLSQAHGIVAEVDLGTENLRWMGDLRFTYGFFVRLMKKTMYPCELAIKIDIPTKSQIREHYRQELARPKQSIQEQRAADGHNGPSSANLGGLPPLTYGTVNSPLPESFTPIPGDRMGNFYAGNMALMTAKANFFPATVPSDGFLDLITIEGDAGRINAIKSFLAVENGKFFDMPYVNYRKISGYRITPTRQEGKDGFIAIDGERIPFEPFQAEVHRGLGTVLSRNGMMYEADGVVPRELNMS